MAYKYNPFTGEFDRVLNDTTTDQSYPVTPYVVGPVGQAGYQTIQAACDAANAAGGGIVVVQPGTYTEDLTLYDAVHVMGLTFADAGGGANIVGKHTPPTSGGFVFNNVRLTSATHIFDSAAVGTAHLVMGNAEIFVTNGYTFNLPNWTGKLESFDVNSAVSTNDGYINNTGGSEVDIFECSVGQGSTNTMIISGVFLVAGGNIYCPVDCQTGAILDVSFSTINNAITFSNDSAGTITNSYITHSSNAAVTMDSSGSLSLDSTVVDSPNNPSIEGSGAGTLTLTVVALPDDNNLAGTLTVAGGNQYSATYKSDYTDGGVLLGQGALTNIVATAAGTNGQVLLGGTAVDPLFADLTSTGATITFTAGVNSLNLEAGGGVAITFTTDSGNATPVANVINILGGGSTTTTGAGNTVTVVMTGLTNHSVLVGAGTTTITKVGPDAASGIPLISQGAASDPIFGTAVIAGGGTGATSFTTGSVIFMGASTLAEDNANFFWDDTNNRLGLGITTPLDTFHVVGAMELDHTAAEADDHAFEIVTNAAGFGDVKAIDIDYITGALAAGDDEEVILVNIDESASTGGTISGYQVLTTSEGSASINGYVTGININPILHNSGTFGDIDDILNKAVDVTAALASGGAGSITTFVADNDTMTFGDAAVWNEMEVIVGTPASGAGIAPTFEFSTGGAGFTAFVPSDGTNGLRNTGAILWVTADLVGWATNASGLFEIRMTRTRNSLSTVPILDEVQLSAATEFIWDLNGDVNLNSLTLVSPLTVPNGGTGVATLTDGGILLGSGTGAITATAQPTNGELLIGSTGVDPVLANLTSTGSTITITNGAGTINLETGTTVASSFPTDSGTAVPAAGALTVTGSGGITTSGSGSTVTIIGTGEMEVPLTLLDDTDSPYTVLSTDYYMSCDVSAGVLTIDLPDAPNTGRVFIVKDSGGDAASNNITVTTTGGAVTIDGATTRVIATGFASLQFIFNGTSYEVF